MVGRRPATAPPLADKQPYRLEAWQPEALAAIKTHRGLDASEQVRRAVTVWIKQHADMYPELENIDKDQP